MVIHVKIDIYKITTSNNLTSSRGDKNYPTHRNYIYSQLKPIYEKDVVDYLNVPKIRIKQYTT